MTRTCRRCGGPRTLRTLDVIAIIDAKLGTDIGPVCAACEYQLMQQAAAALTKEQ